MLDAKYPVALHHYKETAAQCNKGYRWIFDVMRLSPWDFLGH